MRYLSKNPKRILDLTHLVFASVWLGGFAIMLVYSIMLSTQTIDPVFALTSIGLIQEIIKICIPALMVTGLLYGLTTKWGFFTHGWLIAKWILTCVVIIATAIVPVNPFCLSGIVAGILVLFVISVFKPRKKASTGASVNSN